MKSKLNCISLFFILFVFQTLSAQVITSGQIDSLVEKTLKTFDVPGIAVAVIKDGKVIHSKGYGVRSLNTKERVDEHTLFGIASNSKAFTTAALAMLVDEKKLSWDDKVIDHIPEFRMYDPYVTAEFTIRDLLTHRSGLGLGAGDLMFFPDGSDFTINDIIKNIRYLKPVSGFRTKYDYDNNLYVVAGEVIHRVSGMSWENFIQTRILQPLQMNETAPSYELLKNKTNVIDAHAPVDGKLQVIAREWNSVANAAGGIYSNITDMAKWAILQMDSGRYDNDKRLFSEETHTEMWTPQTIIPVSGKNPYNTHFASYGLGWFLSDVKGNLQASHTGGLAGIVTQVTLIPDIRLGIIVFTNQQSGYAFNSITNTIKDSYLGITASDRINGYNNRRLAGEKNADDIKQKLQKEILAAQQNGVKTEMNNFIGVYNDKWLGDITISVKNGKPWFDSKRSPRLTGEMIHYKGNTFIVKWNDRTMDADSFAMFDTDSEGKATGIKMKAISPLTDFSYDFHDLDLRKVK